MDLNSKVIADIHRDLCIGCQLCYVACEDGAHQCIEPYTVAGNGKKNANGMGVHVPRIIEDECVGCNLCALVCPVDNCITMEQIDTGRPFESWNMRVQRLAANPGNLTLVVNRPGFVHVLDWIALAKRIVVVGAGFGGLEAATDLDRMFRDGREAEILLVSDQNHLLFTPLLPQIASSYTDPRHIVQAVREIRGRRRFRFRRDAVRAVDAQNRRLIFDSGTVEYDALILAPGSRTEYFDIPGARENSWDYKTLQDAVELRPLRERIIDLCEHRGPHRGFGCAPVDAYIRDKQSAVGYTGIELVTEMRDFLFRYVTRAYRGIQAPEIRLIVLEATPDILRGSIGPRLAAHAR